MNTIYLLVVLLGQMIPSENPDGLSLVVPSEYPSIQEAINAAKEGDTIYVESDIYYENIDFIGKNIALIGKGYPTIDGQKLGACVVMKSGEGNGAILDGFIITNGSGETVDYDGSIRTVGGGIALLEASPIIRNNIIKDCHLSIYSNGGRGGGIYVGLNSFSGSYTPPKISAKIIHNTIIDCSSWYGGGICYLFGDKGGRISRNTIINCLACMGSAVRTWLHHTGFEVNHNIFYSNGDQTIWDFNCAVHLHTQDMDAPPLETRTYYFINNIISNNAGHGIWAHKVGYLILINNTITKNTWEGFLCLAGSMNWYDVMEAYSVNNIYYGNGLNPIHNQFSVGVGYHCKMVFDHDCIENGEAGIWAHKTAAYQYGNSCIDGNPLLLDNSRLNTASPCIDAGNKDIYAIMDIDYDERPIGNGPDIGADETKEN